MGRPARTCFYQPARFSLLLTLSTLHSHNLSLSLSLPLPFPLLPPLTSKQRVAEERETASQGDQTSRETERERELQHHNPCSTGYNPIPISPPMSKKPSFAEPLPFLKSLPLAPEYRPTPSEFQDPISYILKIEPEASRYGICKIIPPLPPAPKSAAVANLNLSFSARSPSGDPTFTTRQQQIGFCPRRPRPVQKSVWQSGSRYTLSQFQARARAFERSHLPKSRKKKKSPLSPIEVESLFWKTAADKLSTVEYANDIPGSGFARQGERGARDAENVGETEWNMRGVARAKGSLLRFMREEISGVTSPMIYVAMLFSWFAWHVEDHDLHSLNYLHFGAGKTWYGVPRDAALAFEEVVRVYGYGGEVNALSKIMDFYFAT